MRVHRQGNPCSLSFPYSSRTLFPPKPEGVQVSFPKIIKEWTDINVKRKGQLKKELSY